METFGMKTMRSLKWTVVGAVAACGVFGALQGCELIVDFDRSKIPSDSGFEDDVLISDGGEDASDASSVGSDATSGGDASDATVSTADSATDGGPEGDVVVAADSASDAADGSTGVESDGGTESGSGVPEAGTDASLPTDGATGVADTGPGDTGVVDTGVVDTGVIDTGVIDTGVVDTGVVDSGAVETGSPAEASVPVDAGDDGSPPDAEGDP